VPHCREASPVGSIFFRAGAVGGVARWGPWQAKGPRGRRLSCNLGRANVFDATAPGQVSLGGNKPPGGWGRSSETQKEAPPLGQEGVLADSEIPQAHPG
jgi:hypothetical protein